MVRFYGQVGQGRQRSDIGITGKYTSVRDSYASILHSLEHAGIHLGCKVNVEWIETRA